ncbi:lipoprotein signal peptidase [Flavobacterium salilacus subsp. salilacus]|uniref:lipoprotein signal peptidase n=1 Tax=Flavobacterium TaxID=237 RepID=UPI001075178F|nr:MULTISPECIES: lipoprotein signal peptidase [Flavobacterium]KAF2515799.1 lipoprotein signal peptidase [Flavobacterium salilacus subsp. salilacus]MBE1615399.1 lipoprotein signal peptidase [Flavobacterium sp. SaA2.13]
MSLKKAYLIAVIVLLIDQISKIIVKTTMKLDESFTVLEQDWFRIHFIENEGMAWGAEIPGMYGKLFLTLFRIAAVAGIGWWLHDSVKKKYSAYLIVPIALILAGAFGNIIDSVFYGVIFDHSHGQVATLFADEPYGKLLYGKVVDMFYFPIWRGTLPSWLPFWGGQEFSFFNAIFNVADAAISIGVGILIAFNKRAFAKKETVVTE